MIIEYYSDLNNHKINYSSVQGYKLIHICYKNSRQETKGQLSLFDEDEIKESNKSYYAEEARNLLQQHFAGKNAKYDEIELFIMENTILAADDVIQFVLKPMIQNGSLIKKNETQNKHNYKKDTYYIRKEI